MFKKNAFEFSFFSETSENKLAITISIDDQSCLVDVVFVNWEIGAVSKQQRLCSMV